MRIGTKEFDLKNKYYMMGILNVTPDSFSDGGKWNSLDAALKHTEEMIADGCEILDIGGESTRPGYTLLSDEEEIARVVPVIEAVKARFDIPISLDTYKSGVARAGLAAGADLINDIWGCKYDPKMASVIAQAGVPCCLMHNRKEAVYENYLEDVLSDLQECADIAIRAGVRPDQIILDPGIGFGKTLEHNLELMAHLEMLQQLGYPVLLGTSRKSMIGLTLDLPKDERVEGTIATTVMGAMKGCHIFRVHDVKENKRALDMTLAIEAYNPTTKPAEPEEVEEIRLNGKTGHEDVIHVKNLEVFAYHGVLPEEARDGQYFYINADLVMSLREAGITDDLTQTINYAEVCQDLNELFTQSRHELIETCAEELADHLLLKYRDQVSEVRIEILKPSAPIGLPLETVSVEVNRKWHTVFLGIGSNMGDKKGYLDFAVEQLGEAKEIEVLKVATYIETEPYGYTDQDTFLNSVVMARTILGPEELLDVCQSIEQKADRVRKIHWGPRTLDVDVLFYDHAQIRTERLIVPHPDLYNRDFVLQPLREIAPWWLGEK